MRILLLVMGLAFWASPVHAATIHVPGNYSSIQDAINNAVNGDTVLVAPGTYTENINFMGKAITVTSSGGAAKTRIDGGEKESVVTFNHQETDLSVLSGFSLSNGLGTMVYGSINKRCGGGVLCVNASSPTIINNHIYGNEIMGYGGGVFCYQNAAPKILQNEIGHNSTEGGGGIYCDNASPLIKDNQFIFNYGFHGGGICCENASPSIQNNLFEDNSAYFGGGGIYCAQGAPVIEDNLFDDNSAFGITDSSGGGICAIYSDVQIKNNILRENYALRGGGISCTGQGVVTHNTIYINTAKLKGGGIQASANVVISNNLIYSNNTSSSLSSGGGICVGGKATVIGNTIYKNSSKNLGGGIQVEEISSAIVVSNRVYDNTSNMGAGICCDKQSNPVIQSNMIHGNQAHIDGGGLMCGDYSAMVGVNNTIVNNSAGGSGGGIICIYSQPTLINSIIRGNSAPNSKEIKGMPYVSYSNVEGGWNGPGNIDADPQFADPKVNDFHLLFTSPCKDSGDSATPYLPSNDFENDPRVADSSADMGADEFNYHIYVTGDLKPFTNIDVRIVGAPATWPVGFWVGFDLYSNPIPTAWGDWYLKFPVLGPVVLGPLPGNGLVKLTGKLPIDSYGLTFYLHALIGNTLSNIHEVYVH